VSAFALSKWYLDLVSDEGETAIVYAAVLRLGSLEIPYASLLHADAVGTVRTRTSLDRVEPEIDGDLGRIRCRVEGLDVAGLWQPLEGEIAETLLARDDGSLRWRCVAPRARAALSIDGIPFEGLGYVEHVALDIPAWQLPIQTLRWGRVLTARDSLVWIDWRGPVAVQRAFRNGRRVDPIEVDDDALRVRDTSVRFRDNRVLRQGAIGTTALSVLGRTLRGRVPGSALLLDEKKWRAEIELDGARGWAIHEIVSWP
jgi:hypothetical protein